MRNTRKGLIGLIGLLLTIILLTGTVAFAIDNMPMDEPEAQMYAKFFAGKLKLQGYIVTLTYEAGWYVIDAKTTPLMDRYGMKSLVVRITESDPIPLK